MDYDLLWNIGEQVRHGTRLAPEAKHFIAKIVPRELAKFPRIAFPRHVRHPAGFSLAGAPIGTLARCVLVLSAQRVFGPAYDSRSEFYHRVAADLAFCAMRSHFHHGFPKGLHCCAQCSLAVYPVLEAEALRWFDCSSLAPTVRKLIEGHQWRFTGSTNPRMMAWAVEEPKV
jgi:hypothetical protein